MPKSYGESILADKIKMKKVMPCLLVICKNLHRKL